MAALKDVWMKTKNARWHLTIKDWPGGYICEYSGTSAKHDRTVRGGRTTTVTSNFSHSHTVSGADPEKLLADARKAIEGIDGPIESES